MPMGGGKTKTLICGQSIGIMADKAHVLTTYERTIMNNEEQAKRLFRKAKQYELDNFLQRMPDGKKGVEVEINGRKYIAAIRRLTPTECGSLQGIPQWYDWGGTSETQQYKMLGNGWQCDTIKHCWSFLPDFGRPIRVWSLFDGMSCASITLRELGIPVEVLVSSEVDKHAIAAEKQNFPNMVQVGSVTDINVPELVEKYGIPDFICGGSPCQSFSFSGKLKGMATKQGEEIYTLSRYLQLKNEGFQFEGQSYLFWEYMRILTELRQFNPGILFFLENVEMLEKWERCLSHAIGIRGVHINSALVCAQQRKRIYWSNIRVRETGATALFDFSDDPFEWPTLVTDIPQPEDRGIVIKDILLDDTDSKYYLNSEVVKNLMDKTDNRKLKDYMETPQLSVEELLHFMETDEEYAAMDEDERKALAELAYKAEEQRLKTYGYDADGSLFNS